VVRRATRAVSSEDDDAAAAGVAARAERSEHVAGPKGQCREGTGCGGECPPIPSCIRDEKNHVIRGTVTLLERKPTFENLEIVEDGLSLDGQPPAGTADHRVPGAPIPFDRKRDFRRPAEGRVQAQAESFEEALLADVPDRVARRIGSEPQIQANHRTHRREDTNVHDAGDAALDSTLRGPGDSACSPNGILAEPGIPARGRNVGPDASIVLGDSASGPIRGTRFGSHRTELFVHAIASSSTGPSLVIHAPHAANDEQRSKAAVDPVRGGASFVLWRARRVNRRPDAAPNAVGRVGGITVGLTARISRQR